MGRCLIFSDQRMREHLASTFNKVHKTNTPGRPIISLWGVPTKNISLYVDCHLSSLVRKFPSYIIDTNNFLTKIQTLGGLPAESLLVTLDMTSLYTNIPHKEGLDACREILDSRTIQDWLPDPSSILNTWTEQLLLQQPSLSTNSRYRSNSCMLNIQWYSTRTILAITSFSCVFVCTM